MAAPAKPEKSRLRFDGLYAQPRTEEDQAHQFFRFYPDGVVANASVLWSGEEDLARLVGRWLRRPKAAPGEGTYSLAGKALQIRLEIPTTPGPGVIEYWGTLEGEELVLEVYSHITNHQGSLRCRFEEVPLAE